MKTSRKKTDFVDEAGDPNIFNRKGLDIIGKEGCSRFFSLGLLEVGDADSLTRDLESLRLSFTNDPYFKGIPS